MLAGYSLTSCFPIQGQSPLLSATSITQHCCHSPGQKGVDIVRSCWVWAQRGRDHKCCSLGPVLAPVVRPVGPKTGRDRLTKHHIAWKGGQKGQFWWSLEAHRLADNNSPTLNLCQANNQGSDNVPHSLLCILPPLALVHTDHVPPKSWQAHPPLLFLTHLPVPPRERDRREGSGW